MPNTNRSRPGAPPVRGSRSPRHPSSCFMSSCFSSPLLTGYSQARRFPKTDGVIRGRLQGGHGGASGALSLIHKNRNQIKHNHLPDPSPFPANFFSPPPSHVSCLHVSASALTTGTIRCPSRAPAGTPRVARGTIGGLSGDQRGTRPMRFLATSKSQPKLQQ